MKSVVGHSGKLDLVPLVGGLKFGTVCVEYMLVPSNSTRITIFNLSRGRTNAIVGLEQLNPF